MSDREYEELTQKIQELDRARRELAQALDASRLGSMEGDRWPRVLPQKRNIDRRPFLLGVTAVMLAAVFMTWEWTAAPEAAPQKTASSVIADAAPPAIARPAASPPAPVPEVPALAAAAQPLVVHIKVLRPCSVRVVVDDVPLDWRVLKPGDEMISRPMRDITIETDDAGALTAIVNGAPVSLGADGVPSTRSFTR